MGYAGVIHIWIKQVDLISTDEDNYYISKLYFKLNELYIQTHEQLKKYSSDFSEKYFKDKNELQLVFPGLCIEEIFNFNEKFRKIDGHENALEFLDQNIKVWESVLKYFGPTG